LAPAALNRFIYAKDQRVVLVVKGSNQQAQQNLGHIQRLTHCPVEHLVVLREFPLSFKTITRRAAVTVRFPV
jgi:hypothetical protein